jgi:hypothetical protein
MCWTPGDAARPVRRLEAFQVCRLDDPSSLVPLEDVDGASTAVRGQGRLTPAGTAGGEALASHCQGAGALWEPCKGSAKCAIQELWAQCKKHALRQSCQRRTLGVMAATDRACAPAGAAKESLHVRTGALQEWCIDYSGSDPALWVATEHAWCAPSLHCISSSHRDPPVKGASLTRQVQHGPCMARGPAVQSRHAF